MLKHRLITALILIPIVIAALFWLPLAGFMVMTLAICTLGAWEWAQLAGFTTRFSRILIAVLCGLLLAFMSLTLFSYNHSAHVPQIVCSLWSGIIWWCVALFMVLSYPRSAQLWRRSTLSKLLFGLLTLVPFFWGMIALRQYGFEENSATGAWWLLYVMVLVWGADSGAYFVGRRFGKRKLAPSVSPAKTWEGVLGGLVTSALIACVFSLYAPLTVAPHALIISSIVATLASVLGDLSESMFKREAGIKDSGHLIPGHGGILDRIDSLTAAVPVFACLMLLVF